MASYRTVSVGTVIAKLYRDFNFEDHNFVVDAVEWAGEAIEHIGSYNQLEKKELVLEASDFKVAIPADLFYLQQIFYAPGEGITTDNFKNMPKYPLVKDTSTMHKGIHSSISGDIPILTEHSYVYTPGFWHFSFETGVVGISYMAISLDENGYPTIPDDISYKEAITWYILNRMILGGYKHIDPSITFESTRMLWMNYCTQARNKMMIQDIGDLERFKNNWVRLVNNVDRSINFFREQYLNVPIGYLYGNEHIDFDVP
jgi:hypothetical protein